MLFHNCISGFLETGNETLSWIGNFQNLSAASGFEQNPFEANANPFPVKPRDKRSYSQSIVVWINQHGLQVVQQKLASEC